MMQPMKANCPEEITLFKDRLTIALKAAKICVFEVDLTQQLYTFFENSEDIFGVTGDVILREVQPYSKLDPEEYRLAVSNYFAHPEDAEIIAEAFSTVLSGRSTTYEARMRAGGSNYIWCKIDITPILHHNEPVKMIGVITNISELKRKNDVLKEKASLDLFTGIYHKQAAFTRMEQVLSQQKDQSHALALIDIDKFKAHNDIYGHYEGDKAIKKLADLLKETFRSSEILGRFGGDEFIVLITDFSDAAWLCEKIQPIVKFQSGVHSLTTSIGVAVYPQDAVTFEDLFQKADQALYDSKTKEDPISFFSQFDQLK